MSPVFTFPERGNCQGIVGRWYEKGGPGMDRAALRTAMRESANGQS
jgi:hypothetical protein